MRGHGPAPARGRTCAGPPSALARPILSDRSLSRLLAADWPRTLEELEKNPGLGLRGGRGD